MTSCVQNNLAFSTVIESSSQSPSLKPIRKVSSLLITSNNLYQSSIHLKLNTNLISCVNFSNTQTVNQPQNIKSPKKLVVFRPKKPNQQKNSFMSPVNSCGSLVKDLGVKAFSIILSLWNWIKMMVLLMVHAIDTVLVTVENFILNTIKEIVVLDYGKHKPMFNKLLRTCLFMTNDNHAKNQKRSKNLKKKGIQKRERKELTLVLDLDETLVHSSLAKPTEGEFQSFMVTKNNGTYQQVYLKKRPHLEDFLDKVSEEYNLIIFTASSMEYAEIAIDLIDNNCVISRRFYRQSCTKTANGWAKNLTRIEPDLNKVVLIDNCNIAGSIQPENHLLITSWFSDENDKCLLEYADFLLEFSKQWKEDVSEAKDMRNYIKGFKDKYNQDKSSLVEEKSK